MIVEYFLLAGLIFLSGFFSATETALFSLTHTHLLDFEQSSDYRRKLAARIMEHPNHVLTSLLLGNNSINIMFVLVADRIFHHLKNSWELFTSHSLVSILSEMLIIVVLLLVTGELIPKQIALKSPVAILKFTIGPFYLFHQLIGILKIRNFITFFSNRFLTGIRRVFGDSTEHADHNDIRYAVELAVKEGNLSDDEAALADKVLELKDLPLSKIMVDKSLIHTVYTDDSITDAVNAGSKFGYNIIPVMNKKKNTIAGFFNINQAILSGRKGIVKQVMTPPWFIAKVNASEMLLEMLMTKNHEIAVVIDEFGEFAGIINKEHVLKSLVKSENLPESRVEQDIRHTDKGIYVRGDTELDYLEKILNFKFPKGEYHTINGYLTSRTGKIPNEKEWLVVNGMKFYIDEARPNKIVRIFIELEGGM